jgi:soluble lytic murein transglycosylase-like protein
VTKVECFQHYIWEINGEQPIKRFARAVAVLLLIATFVRMDNPAHKSQAAELNKQDVQTESKLEAQVSVQPQSQPKVEEQAPTPAPAPVEQPKPQPITHPVGCEHYRQLISQYDWNVEVAMKVMQAESSCDPTEVNDNPDTRDYSVGLFQINLYGANARTRPSEAALKDPATNIAWAYKLYSGNKKSFIGQWGVCRVKVSCY